MSTILNSTIFSAALAMSCLGTFESLRAQSGPTFRTRTDVNAERDLQRLREELNKATDANGPINPLGAFLQRDAEAIERAQANEAAEGARLDIGPSDQEKVQDTESERAPRLDPSATKRPLEPAPLTKPHRTIGVLPGPRYTIIQQASPQVRVADRFRPARLVADMEATVRPSLQYPVTLASANLPSVGQPTNVISNFQEVPFGSNPNNSIPTIPSGVFNPGAGFPGPTSLVPNNAPILFGGNNTVPSNDAINQPILPFNPNPSTSNPGPAPIYSTPLQGGNPPTIANPPQTYIAPPSYPSAPITGPAYNPGPVYNAVPLANPNILPSYPRSSSSIVNGAPFVSNAPCQFDARYMVSREAYRQSADPCAPRGSPYAPYATQPGGSPFSYVPQTGMAYNNNGYDSGYRSLFGFGQTLNNAYLGRGIIGQPTAYVEGQPVRNFLRYISP